MLGQKVIEKIDYQIEAVPIVCKALIEHLRSLVIMASGMGKTVLAALVTELMMSQHTQGRFRVLVLCHDSDILGQNEPTFRAVLGTSVSTGFFTGHDKDGIDADIMFATFQMLVNRKEEFHSDAFDLIIVDEAHHAPAETYEEVIRYFSGNTSLLGITASLKRMDGKLLEDIFGEPTIHIPLEEAIALGRLTPFKYKVISDGLNTGVVREITKKIKGGKQFTLSDVNRILFIELRDEEVVKRIKKEAGSKKSLVFCQSIEHANRIVALLGKCSKAYHSGFSKSVNDLTFGGFRGKKTQFLVAVNKANEGLHIPDAEAVFLLRDTGSRTVFEQQLGRILAKLRGKNIAYVYDFVGSLRHLRMLADVTREDRNRPGIPLDCFSVSGKGFEFIFDSYLVDALKIFDLLERDFYPTWQEASEAVQKFGFKTMREYGEGYKKDPRLPSAPRESYPDYPGDTVFLGGEKPVKKYPTCQEASKATQKLGIETVGEYQKRYKEDPRLPSSPDAVYQDFPGYSIFLGTRENVERYSTCQEASKATQKLGIETGGEYKKRYKEDPRLPSVPRVYYPDYPGDTVFLGGEKPVKKYPTWQEASKAAQKLGIETMKEYGDRYKEDPRLPSDPRVSYQDFPGVKVFLGGKYLTWQEASKAAQKLGIETMGEYKKRYKEDPRLPSAPRASYPDFPGNVVFFGGEKPVKKYPTWQEASKAAQKLGIKSKNEYSKNYKKDLSLPSDPFAFYQDFPGYPVFLGMEKS